MDAPVREACSVPAVPPIVILVTDCVVPPRVEHNATISPAVGALNAPKSTEATFVVANACPRNVIDGGRTPLFAGGLRGINMAYCNF